VLPRCSEQPNNNSAAPCQAQVIREQEKRIRDLHLPDDSTHLLIGNLYAANELYAEATEEFEAVLAAARTPAVIRQLGDVYASVGLNREAEKQYLEVLGLPQMANDAEAQALTLHSLALTYEKLGILDLARTRYDQAITAYAKLGDDITVAALKSQQAKLANQNK
jgi:tetratricopeptide (TPR) repeat protein